MARVNRVKRCRKSPGACGKCGKKIPKGASYIFWKFRFGGKRIRCVLCPPPRPSDLTSSDKLSRVYAAGESIEDAVRDFVGDHDVETLRGACEEAAGELREVADEYRESASNVESGMNGNRMPICDELEEKADNLESKADEIEQAASGLSEFDEEEAENEAEEEVDEFEKGGREDKLKEIVEKKRKEWAEEQAASLEEIEVDVEG